MKCLTKGCKNIPVVYPVLLMKPKGYDCDPAQIVVKLPLCFTCKCKTKVEDIVNDYGWDALMEIFDTIGKIRPTRKLTKLTFVDIEDGDEALKDDYTKH